MAPRLTGVGEKGTLKTEAQINSIESQNRALPGWPMPVFASSSDYTRRLKRNDEEERSNPASRGLGWRTSRAAAALSPKRLPTPARRDHDGPGASVLGRVTRSEAGSHGPGGQRGFTVARVTRSEAGSHGLGAQRSFTVGRVTTSEAGRHGSGAPR
ncbi:uncharacterized protein LOC144097463 [Amblyomma americanum]